MAGQIRVTPETMHGRATEFRTAKGNFEQVIQSITTLQDEWEGEASRQFAAQFESLRPSFNEMGELIESIARQCDGVAEATERLDSEMARKFSS